MCPRNFEGSSAKASLELKYDGGLGTAHGRLRLVHVGTTASDRSMSIAKPGGKTAWAAAIWRRMLRARVVWPAMLIQRTTSGAAGAEIRGKSAAEQAAADMGARCRTPGCTGVTAARWRVSRCVGECGTAG